MLDRLVAGICHCFWCLISFIWPRGGRSNSDTVYPSPERQPTTFLPVEYENDSPVRDNVPAVSPQIDPGNNAPPHEIISLKSPPDDTASDIPLQTGPLGALPLDIFLEVITHLTAPSLVSLALTCKDFYQLCFPERPPFTREDRAEILQLLEKDTPSVVYCHPCDKLHAWYIGPLFGRFNVRRCKSQVENQVYSSDLHIDDSCFSQRISFILARCIMNRHLYGPSHGPPVNQLRRQTERQLGQIAYSDTLDARTVEGNLLLCSKKTIYHVDGDFGALRLHIDETEDYVCEHLTLHRPGHYVRLLTQLPELSRGVYASKQSFGSCILCMADYSIDITRSGTEKGLIITVNIYRQLGDCRSPSDWSWVTMAHEVTQEEPRTAYAYPGVCGPGVVRDRWFKGEGIEIKTESEWVDFAGVTKRRDRYLHKKERDTRDSLLY